MSTSTGAFGVAAQSRKRASRKILPQHLLGGVAVAGVVLGCAWTVYTNVFGASIYPSVNSAAVEAPVIRRSIVVAARPTADLQRGVRIGARAGVDDFRNPRPLQLRSCLTKGLQHQPAK